MEDSSFRFPLEKYPTLRRLFTALVEKYSSSIYLEYWKNPNDDRPTPLTYHEVDVITSNLARRLQNEYNLHGQAVAYLADHSIQYGLYLIALVKLECRTMLISPKNSEAAIVDLLNKTNTKTFLHNKRFEKEANAVTDQIDEANSFLAFDVDIEKLKELDIEAQSLPPMDDSSENQMERIAFIIHSSGTTGFPKPIQLSHRYMAHMFEHIAKIFGHVESPKILSLAPLYHALGIIFFAFGIMGGTCIFPTDFPPLTNTVFESLKKSQANCMVTPPISLENIADSIKAGNADADALKKLQLIGFGGAALQQQVGNFLIEYGLNIKSLYGATEMGLVAMADVDPNCKEFASLKLYVPEKYYIMEDTDIGSEVKHLVILPNSPFMATNVSNRADGSYASNDLWTPHPSKPGYWNICGRSDDTLIMSNAEKTNPAPMEAAMRNFHRLIEHCAVLGQGRAATSVLVELNVEEAMRNDIYDILNIVESAVDVANRDAPSHSRLVFPDMVKILPLSEKLPVTDKGTISRKKAEKQYESYVENMYDRFFNKSSDLKQDNGHKKLPLEIGAITNFLKSVVAKLIKIQPSQVHDTLNLFDQGLDSLLAAQLRNSIVKNIKDVPSNFVFQNSTIESMTQAICRGSEADKDVESSYRSTKWLLEKYMKLIDVTMPQPTKSYQQNKEGEVAVLTGATGSLGALLLQDLLQNQSVRKVYTLVRGNDGVGRLKQAFADRALDTKLLESPKLQIYPFDQAKQSLGLDSSQYSNMQSEATMICHCAWMLDFLQPVTYYEKECINGLFNLLQLAYNGGKNSMRFHFISSVSASMAMKGDVLEQPLPDDPSCAIPMGYAQSKFISEHLMRYVTEAKSIQGYVERVGQMSGDTINGYWSSSEQYPLMVAGGAVHMKKMPTMNIEIDWIPLNFSAAAIVEIMMNTANDPPSPTESIFHIVNPNRVTWTDFLQALQDNGLKFRRVSPEEWINELSEDDSNPAFKLISFYQDVFGKVEMPLWLTTRTQIVSRQLKETPKLDANMVGKYIQYWKRIGFFN